MINFIKNSIIRAIEIKTNITKVIILWNQWILYMPKLAKWREWKEKWKIGRKATNNSQVIIKKQLCTFDILNYK